MKYPFSTVVAGIVFLVGVTCQSCRTEKHRKLSRAEAEKALKVLNSDLMYVIQEAGEDKGIATMHVLYQKGAIPLPGFGKVQKSEGAMVPGTYYWNDSTSTFYRTTEGPTCSFAYQDAGLPCENTRLAVEVYEELVSHVYRRFPMNLRAVLYLDDIKNLAVEHSAIVRDALPVFMETWIEGNAYSISVDLVRSRNKGKGKLDLKVDVVYKFQSLFTLDLQADLLYHDPGCSADGIKFDMHVMGKRIVGHIAYGDIDPTSARYVRDFNRCSDLVFYDERGFVIGDIVLAHDDHTSNTQDFAVRFSDGSTAMLKQYVLPFDALMNLKF